MADITYWGLTSTKGTVTVDLTTDTFDTLIDAIASDEGLPTEYYTVSLQRNPSIGDIVYGDSSTPLDDASIGMVDGDTVICTPNQSGTKEYRQKQKLDIAAATRAADGDSRATYDITELPTQYSDNSIIDNPNTSGLQPGRPWINTVTFTFYEAFGTTATITTTQYVSGNKIYAESSTYDVPNYQNARIIVNDIEVANTALRGHTLIVLDTYGDVVTAATQYDTYIDPNNLTSLASALNAVASGNIVVLVVYDASALDAGVRSAINTGYGSTNTDTWTPERRSHIFIGIKS
jgi:hypothetical protein